MPQVMTFAARMAERKLSLAELVAASGLEERLVAAIAAGRYTPSPEQRQRLAEALGVGIEEISWEHATPVEHMYGHGPQFGRSP
jgi:transcriptional regulator with XRE-family HTH domain